MGFNFSHVKWFIFKFDMQLALGDVVKFTVDPQSLTTDCVVNCQVHAAVWFFISVVLNDEVAPDLHSTFSIDVIAETVFKILI